MGKKLWLVEGKRYGFHCPGCGHPHVIPTETSDNGWNFNGDLERPTFSPSLLNWIPENKKEGIPEYRCHLHVEKGQLKYCVDCTHAFKGKTLPMEDVQ